MRRPTQDKTKVSITEKAPDAAQIEQWAKNDPTGAARHFAKLSARLVRRRETSRRETKKINEIQQEKTNRRKQTAINIIEQLIKKDSSLRLRGQQSRLAEYVRERWPRREEPPAVDTLRHWFAEMSLEK